MKNNIPFIIVAFIVVIIAAVWFSQKSDFPALVEDIPSATPDTPTIVEKEAPTAPLPTNTSGNSGLLPGVSVANQTLWNVFMNERWDITFRYKPEWEIGLTKSENGAVDQVSFLNDEASILLSRKMSIAEPSLLTYKTYTRMVAGQKVEVHEYTQPNEPYLYYLYFTLTADRTDYSVSIKSLVSSKKHADDFIEGIKVK